MAESYRRETISPKSSPRGSRSPAVPRQDSTGTLKTTIQLGKNPAIVQKGPFYLMKDLPEQSEVTGSVNLMSYNNLEHSYNKCSGKKLKEELSAFLPNLPGNIDNPGHQDNSSLRSVIDKPPIVGKELNMLTSSQLASFRLHPGPLPEQYRLMNQVTLKKKHKHKKHKKEIGKEGPLVENTVDNGSDVSHDKKHKKKGEEREKRKKKKEKKKKRKHSPEHPGSTDNGKVS